MAPGTVFSPQYFRFHDIAAATVSSDAPFARKFFQAEYDYHRVDSNTPELRQDLPLVNLDFQMGNAAPPGFTRHTHKLLARWNYQLSIRPGEIGLRVFGNQAAVSMIHHMLLHPSLRWLAANSGTLLLHAGAVARNNKSLIFTGKGGAGKTTTTSLVLGSESGWQIHADDYIFLRPAQSLAYVTRSHLYRDLLNWVPGIAARLTAWERTRLEIFGALRKYSREGLKWPVRLSPRLLWPGTPIANTAYPAAILLLERADVPGPGIMPVHDLEATARDLLEMNFGEARHFLSLLQKAGALDGQWLSSWKETELSLLNAALLKTPVYRLVLPFSQRAAQTSLTAMLDELVN